MRNGPTPGVVAHEMPTVGAPALVTVSPSASTNRAKPCTNPSAPATPGTRPHLVDRGLGQLRTVAALPVAVEGALVAHDEIDPDAGLGERHVEGAAQRVGQHVDAGDERHAEHDRERGQREPDLAGRDALDRRPPDRAH